MLPGIVADDNGPSSLTGRLAGLYSLQQAYHVHQITQLNGDPKGDAMAMSVRLREGYVPPSIAHA